jgi:adenylate cyclase
VVAVDVSLESFSRFLATLDVSERGAVFLVDQRRRVIGNPDLEDLVAETIQEGGGTELVLKQAGQSENGALAALASNEAFTLAVEGRGEEESLRFEVDGAPHIAALRPIQEGAGDWVIAVVAPEADFLADVQRLNRQNLLTALFFSVATVLLALILARRITQSLEKLVAESAKIQALRFDDQVDTRAPFKEVHDALSAFDGMKTGLRSLQKYLPMKLVRVLLETHQEPKLGGDLLDVTVLFSDIAGFTTISEALGPGPVARRLGDYLGRLTVQIQSRQGTVAHYIGDGIMAFWGAPLPVEDHAVQACHAALECAEIVANLWADEPDAPRFHTRIGLHTATVAVGHFGTPDRMAYSALGDGVNLASRLEGLSKHYGTTVLVSEDTWNRASEHFEARMVDSVRVKGKVNAVAVFELLGVKGAVDGAVLAMKEQYEQGLRHYRAQEWEEAIDCFDRAIEQVSTDRASVALRERCLDYQVHPPPQEWNGEFTMTVK